ncbi:MAG: VOC family protein, partial [Clostridia bacterium]|nr:VOC family protein [Clostridia bacterium]
MRLTEIHHVAIITSDREKTVDFYVGRLGFEIIRETERPERGDIKLDLRVNDLTELEIFIVKDPPARVTRPEARGLRHLAFRVDDVEEAVKWLASKGIETEPVRTDPV